MFLAAANGGSNMMSIIMIIVLAAAMYFMLYRPQKKQQQQRKEMMSKLKKGDKVVTIGGLHGVIDSVDDANQTVTLDCDGIFLVFNIQAVGRVQSDDNTQTQPENTKEETSEDKTEE